MAAEAHLRTKRRLGELLAKMPKNEGGKPSVTSDSVLPVIAPTLTDVGISKMESSRAQAIASIPEPIFEQIVAEHRENVPDTALRAT